MDKEEDDAEMEGGSGKNEVGINGMDILHSDGKHGVMLFATASMKETSELASKSEGDMEEDSAISEKSESIKEKEWQEEEKEASYLTAKMNVATARLHLGSNEEGSNYQEDDMSIRSGDLDLTLQDYVSDTQEVSWVEFDAAFTKKYANPPPPSKHLGLFWREKKTSSFFPATTEQNITHVNLFHLTR
jgi:hypothetical protein